MGIDWSEKAFSWVKGGNYPDTWSTRSNMLVALDGDNPSRSRLTPGFDEKRGSPSYPMLHTPCQVTTTADDDGYGKGNKIEFAISVADREAMPCCSSIQFKFDSMYRIFGEPPISLSTTAPEVPPTTLDVPVTSVDLLPSTSAANVSRKLFTVTTAMTKEPHSPPSTFWLCFRIILVICLLWYIAGVGGIYYAFWLPPVEEDKTEEEGGKNSEEANQ